MTTPTVTYFNFVRFIEILIFSVFQSSIYLLRKTKSIKELPI